MIQKSPLRHQKNACPVPSADWIQELKTALRDPLELCERLQLNPDDLPGGRAGLLAACDAFPLRVTHSWLSRIQPGNPQDPLLLQILPLGAENRVHPDLLLDPLAEAQSNPLPGVIHKYRSRLLLTLSGACAINCRYCFRRHFPYAEQQIGPQRLQALVDYLQQHPEINEVILSGGDPLATSNQRLADLFQVLAELPQLKRLRIHTRLPVALPSRVDSKLLGLIDSTSLHVSIVLHINHPQELDVSLVGAVQRLRETNALLLNQTVLLKGINDDAQLLAQLSEQIFELGLLPYYLHLTDPVQATAHFQVPEERARTIYAELLALLPGFLVPRLVKEEPGKPSKTPLGW